jgi:hypothetical protein
MVRLPKAFSDSAFLDFARVLGRKPYYGSSSTIVNELLFIRLFAQTRRKISADHDHHRSSSSIFFTASTSQ